MKVLFLICYSTNYVIILMSLIYDIMNIIFVFTISVLFDYYILVFTLKK
jgi:hypothetical protein